MVEMATAFEDGIFAHYGNLQHATIFSLAGLLGAVDLLRHHKFPVPEEASYVVIVLFLATEWVLFKYHLHGRKEIDIKAQTPGIF